MRTLEEVQEDIRQAYRTDNAEALQRLAVELDGFGTPQADAAALRARGLALHLREEYQASLALLRRALALNESLGSTKDVASVTGNIGLVLSSMGDYTAALSHNHRALLLHQEVGDRNGVAAVTCNIGLVHSYTSDHPTALEYLHRAQDLSEELGDQLFSANIAFGIGRVYLATGDYPAALDNFHRALALYEGLNDSVGIALITTSIGMVHRRTGDLPAALEHYSRGLELHEQLGNRDGMASAMIGIGLVHMENGDHAAAIDQQRRALALYEELDQRNGVALVSANILHINQRMGADADAKAILLTLDVMEIREPDLRIFIEQQRATLLERDGDIAGAAEVLHLALEKTLTLGLRSQTVDIHKALRDLALKQNDLATYVHHNNEYTRITEEINGRQAATKVAMQSKQREIDAERRDVEKRLSVLHATLPAHVVDRIARNETVSDHDDNAAVIFLDIVGFTTISDRLASDDVVLLLERFFSTLDAVCAKHNVVKIKTIGDSYMAVAFSDAAQQQILRAAECAIEMIAAVRTDTLLSHEIGEVAVRIGVHSGPVTAGVIGTTRLQYDVWGDTVNVASRMESTGEPGRIHVSEAFAHSLTPCLSDTLTLVQRGEISIKGKGTMTTFWLESTST